jgi:hypothetical protein
MKMLIKTDNKKIIFLFILSISIIPFLSGCNTNESKNINVIPSFLNSNDGLLNLQSYILAFHEINNRWPLSKQELINFYNGMQSKMTKKELIVNWDNYNDIIISPIDDKTVRINIKYSKDRSWIETCEITLKLH